MEARDRFPHGMAAVGKMVHQEGQQFLMWFSPESPWTNALEREHPEWVIRWIRTNRFWTGASLT